MCLVLKGEDARRFHEYMEQIVTIDEIGHFHKGAWVSGLYEGQDGKIHIEGGCGAIRPHPTWGKTKSA